MVLTFPNHFLLGSTLGALVGRSWSLAMVGIFWLYILSLLMVLLVLMELPVPEVLPLTTRSGLSGLLDLLVLPNLLWSFLLLAFIPFCYLAIVENYNYRNYKLILFHCHHFPPLDVPEKS